MTAASRDAVMYLVRRSEDVHRVQRFLSAYDARPAGAAHDLLILWKGFAGAPLPEPLAALVRGRPVCSRFIADTGFDVDAYWRAARDSTYDRCCFLNSQSEPLVEGWLAWLFEALEPSRVGLAGATGSFESPYSETARTWRSSLLEGPVWRRARWAAQVARSRVHFAPFPNHHVRTTAFAIRVTTLRRVRCAPMTAKYEAFRFESGRHGLTAQVEKMGLEVRVVGRDGATYQPALWPESATFRSGDQRNLLVADDHTRLFAASDDMTKRALHRAAWGGEGA
ncbi:MAG: hypothetical protein FWD17_11700 [Polyangiaceae bacterium]|nr:hypothetical protein [Polyangiaceae bacterium]